MKKDTEKQAMFSGAWSRLKGKVNSGVQNHVRDQLTEAVGSKQFKDTVESQLKAIGMDAVRATAPGMAAGAISGAATGDHKLNDAPGGLIRGALGGAVGGLTSRNLSTALPMGLLGGASLGGAAGLVGHRKEASIKEQPVKNKYAGVTLDWYDDKGAFLKGKFPSFDKLPTIIKEADIRPKEKLSHEDFALVAIDEGTVLRKYACNDAGTTALSVIYFMEHGDKLPDEAQKTAAANLLDACKQFELAPPAALVKTALIGPAVEMSMLGIPSAVGYALGRGEGRDMARAEEERPKGIRLKDIVGAALVPGYVGYQVGQRSGYDKSEASRAEKAQKTKTSSVIDITGKRPAPKLKVASSLSDDDYAVVLNGKRYYPIHTWDLVKKASDYFEEEHLRMQPEIRRQFAVKLAAKASTIGFPLPQEIAESGSTGWASEEHLKEAMMMRKAASAPGEAREFLDDLMEKKAELDPDTFAECLRRFDVDTGLDKGWNKVVLDPWMSTFGIDKTATVVWEDGADRVTDAQLTDLATHHVKVLHGVLTDEAIREFQKDPVGIFESMPMPQKKFIARLAGEFENESEMSSADPTPADHDRKLHQSV